MVAPIFVAVAWGEDSLHWVNIYAIASIVESGKGCGIHMVHGGVVFTDMSVNDVLDLIKQATRNL